ncbi:LssY C-terminal domain-containing protein [Bradyrhizobium sp. ma5]|uniref:LssY C-terminal domain-containing protein n=1 Tax=Bradyrhizobium sp. ma5 TaxID=3344828 RepID=UPI0035D5142D
MKQPARGRLRRRLIIFGAAAIAYLLLTYVVAPVLWTHHEHEPGLANLPMVTRTADGIPGDALNVGLVGDKQDITRTMHAAEWFPADPRHVAHEHRHRWQRHT